MRAERTRVAIADDHPLFRLGVRTLLANEEPVELVAETDTGEGALALVERVRPDILLLDVNLPDLSGLEVLRRLQAAATVTRTVIVTAAIDPAEIRTAFEHGACGVLLKHTASELLIRCIRQVSRGEYFLGAGEVGALVTALRAPLQPPAPVLSPRELEIARCVVRGLSNKEIAAALKISEQTVKNHLRNVFEKLHVANRVELAIFMVERRLGIDT